MSQYEGFLFDAEMGLGKAEYALTQIHAFHMCPAKDNDHVFEIFNRIVAVRREVQALSREHDRVMKAEG